MREALAARAPIRSVFVSGDHPEADALVAAAEEAGATAVRATSGVLEALSDATTPQGVVAVADMGDVPLTDLDEAADLVLVLDQIRDPGNAGTLVRSAAAAGAAAVVFTTGSVDPYSAKTVRAASASLFRVDVVRDAALDEVSARLRKRGFAVVGTDAAAETSYDALGYTAPVAFVVGNEAWGIPEEDRRLLTDVVAIPMPGDAESLNAGIAGSLLLFEAVRQRRGRLGGTAD